MSWFAGAFELIGTWLVGSKNRWGFIFNLVAITAWISFAFTDIKTNGGLLIICVPAFFISIRNFIKWSKDEYIKTDKNKEPR